MKLSFSSIGPYFCFWHFVVLHLPPNFLRSYFDNSSSSRLSSARSFSSFFEFQFKLGNQGTTKIDQSQVQHWSILLPFPSTLDGTNFDMVLMMSRFSYLHIQPLMFRHMCYGRHSMRVLTTRTQWFQLHFCPLEV
jgi:hypothetical protein